MRRSWLTAETFAEKDFYLHEFHDKSLLLAVRAADILTEPTRPALEEVLITLLRNATRLLLILATDQDERRRQRLVSVMKRLARDGHTVALEPVPLMQEAAAHETHCLQLWDALRTSRLAVGLWPQDAPGGLEAVAQQIAVDLRVYKLMYLDPAGGLVRDGKALSCLTEPALHDLLRATTASSTGLEARQPLLAAMHAALVGGVPSVSLCPLSGVGQELLTYEGCGTLCTRAEYCQIDKLGIDDFHEVERLLQRTEQAGYLKPRTPHEMARLLLHGYCARLGPASMEPVGFCALLPYPEDQTAEIAGLLTITRFQGEGVGGRLVDALVQAAQQQGSRYVFACTTQPGAQRLFIRHGFRQVAPEAVAAAKWHGYDATRRAEVAVYRRELTHLADN